MLQLSCNILFIHLHRKIIPNEITIKYTFTMHKETFFLKFLGIILLTSCQNKIEQSDAHKESKQIDMTEQHAHSDEIVLNPDKAKAAGVLVQKITPGDFYGVIPVSGKILEATGNDVTIVANVSGKVSFLTPITEGIQVSKEKAIFIISGKHLQNGDPAERTRIAYEAAKQEYERASKLVADKIVSEKEYNTIKTEYENARIAYNAISHDRANGAKVTSPLSGYIKSCFVKEGDYVTVGQPLASISQNRHLYLKADVPERYYDKLNKLTSAKFRMSYSDKIYDIQTLGGRLLAYGKNSTETSSYIPVTFEFNNSQDILPGAFAEIYLLTKKRNNVISLPVNAITEEQGVNFVYIKKDTSCYKKQEVELGESNGDMVEILSGLKGNEQVVIEGAIHVKLASTNNIIPAHSHHH